MQILGSLRGDINGWRNTPMVRIWEGYEGVLCLYGIRICEEWISRGYNDNVCYNYFTDMIKKYDTCEFPWWLGLASYHESMQSNLIFKDPEHYSPQFPGVESGLPYFWPVPELRDEFA
jgi:hypothetical protein